MWLERVVSPLGAIAVCVAGVPEAEGKGVLAPPVLVQHVDVLFLVPLSTSALHS